jgi:hypothetical protein
MAVLGCPACIMIFLIWYVSNVSTQYDAVKLSQVLTCCLLPNTGYKLKVACWYHCGKCWQVPVTFGASLLTDRLQFDVEDGCFQVHRAASDVTCLTQLLAWKRSRVCQSCVIISSFLRTHHSPVYTMEHTRETDDQPSCYPRKKAVTLL